MYWQVQSELRHSDVDPGQVKLDFSVGIDDSEGKNVFSTKVDRLSVLNRVQGVPVIGCLRRPKSAQDLDFEIPPKRNIMPKVRSCVSILDF